MECIHLFFLQIVDCIYYFKRPIIQLLVIVGLPRVDNSGEMCQHMICLFFIFKIYLILFLNNYIYIYEIKIIFYHN